MSIILSIVGLGADGTGESLGLKVAFLLLDGTSSFSSLLKLPLWLSNVDILSYESAREL